MIDLEVVSLGVCGIDVMELGIGVVTSNGSVDSAATLVESTREDVFDWKPIIADPVLNE